MRGRTTEAPIRRVARALLAGVDSRDELARRERPGALFPILDYMLERGWLDESDGGYTVTELGRLEMQVLAD